MKMKMKMSSYLKYTLIKVGPKWCELR